MLKDIKIFFNGAVYGMTLIVPGVSATILAVIIGFYKELIWTINHFREDCLKNLRYLLVFALGLTGGAVLFSSIIIHLLEKFSFPVMLFFIGLLAGIVPLIAAKAFLAKHPANGGDQRIIHIIMLRISLSIFSMIGLIFLSRAVNVNTANPAEAIGAVNLSMILYIFIAGILNGATLVIPGLSGALLLLIMGLYPLVIYAISSVGIFFGDITNLVLLRSICLVLLPFGIGALFGCLAMARLMEKLMRDFNEAVHAVILGLILGSIAAIFLDPMIYQSGVSPVLVIIGVITFCAGCVIALLLGRKQATAK